ncbi:MAG: hypothetical protein HUN05_06045 [Desulfobacter sp.]|nr:MAG: hypothetical protein HUN05_06045 [Desulfobacter sp.]
MDYAAALFSFVSKNKKTAKVMPHILSMTLGRVFESGNKAALWGILLPANKKVVAAASRKGITKPGWFEQLTDFRLVSKAIIGSIRHKSIAPLAILTPGIGWSQKMFQEILTHPEGLWIGKTDFENNMDELKTLDGKIHVHIPEMEAWVHEITPEQEAKALVLPMTLSAGRHTSNVANTLMRKPDWNKSRRVCTLAMNPDDAAQLNMVDGEIVSLTTEAASVEIELEITGETRKGEVLMPHGFGLKYKGREHGVNVNRLTKSSHRDRFAATPFHRYVPCRVEKLLV